MTRHIMKPNSIFVEIVENSQALLIPLPVIRLRSIGTSCVGPVYIIISLARWPSDVTTVHLPTGPEVSLPVLGNKSKKLVLLICTVQTYWSHTVSSAEGLPLTLCELGATNSPADEKVLSSIIVVWCMSSCTLSSTASLGLGSSVYILVSIWSSSSISLLPVISKSLLSVISQSLLSVISEPVVPIIISVVSLCQYTASYEDQKENIETDSHGEVL